MPLVNFKSIVSCSSEDRVHCAKNLLKPQQNKKWLSSKGIQERTICILEFAKPSFITSVNIGNDGSASIELLLSRSSSSKTDDWTILLPPTTLMTAAESHSNTNRNQVKVFQLDHSNEKWNRLKIVCEQKYNQSKQFGLNFIKLYSTSDKDNQKEILTNIEDETKKKLKSTPTDELFGETSEIQNDKAQIMKDLILVLSGFQNSVRCELKNKATSMGAICNEDWDEKCTHFVCTYSNTPKVAQVQQIGKGSIVNKQWILDCYEQNQLLPVESYQSKRTSEAKKKKTKSEEGSVVTKGKKRKNPTKNKSINANEDEPNKKKLGELPDFFNGKHFYVSYGDYDDGTLLDITRVILAYDGVLERQINSDVAYVITNRMWNQDFDKISKSNPNINFVNIDWLQDCHDTNESVPMQPYLIIP